MEFFIMFWDPSLQKTYCCLTRLNTANIYNNFFTVLSLFCKWLSRHFKVVLHSINMKKTLGLQKLNINYFCKWTCFYQIHIITENAFTFRLSHENDQSLVCSYCPLSSFRYVHFSYTTYIILVDKSDLYSRIRYMLYPVINKSIKQMYTLNLPI